MVSTPVSIAVVVADVGLLGLLLAGIAHAARRPAQPALLWIGATAVTAWFGLTLVLAASGVYETNAGTTLPPAIAAAVGLPTALGCALLAFAPFRRALAQFPLHWLVGVQVTRVVGGLFLVAYAQGDLPAAFALPAGIGDVLVGLAAPFVARRLARAGADRARPLVLAWCAVGLLDLVVAVTCGLLSAPSSFQQLAPGDPNVAITSYPLVLIPAFAVPSLIALHVYVIARLRRRSEIAVLAQTA